MAPLPLAQKRDGRKKSSCWNRASQHVAFHLVCVSSSQEVISSKGATVGLKVVVSLLDAQGSQGRPQKVPFAKHCMRVSLNHVLD